MTLTPATPQTAPPSSLVIVIPGHNPAPQGSKKAVGKRVNRATGRSSTVLVEQSKRVGPWRQFAALHTRQHVAKARLPEPMDGVLRAEIIFTMQPPKGRPKTRRIWPNTRAYGDIDKLIRSTFDALADGGAVKDDARICDVRAVKLFPGDPGALTAPGAVVRLSYWTEHDADAATVKKR